MKNTETIRPVISATRDSLDLDLELIAGKLPEDMYGFVLINSPVGSVNSGGLPFPEYHEDGKNNKEFGTPIMNGDGYVFQFDLNNPEKIHLKTSLLKPPCYFADEALKYESEASKKMKYAFFPFSNWGISRMSLELGGRNELNTALIPFQFAADAQARLLATYDVGRPFEVDGNTLEVVTPIGKNLEWISAMPPFMHMLFPLVQTTAHPVFDFNKQEMWIVNFTKSTQTMLSSHKLMDLLKKHPEKIEQKLTDLANQIESTDDWENAHSRLNDFFHGLEKEIEGAEDIWNELWKKITGFIKSETQTTDNLYLLKWTGKQEDLQKWQILDEAGNPIAIEQCVHQMSISEDYIILIDASFKFSLDILVNNPFPNNYALDRFIRKVTSKVMEPFTTTYIIRRSDLQDNVKEIKAKKVQIPLECVHFSANYANPNNQITLFMAHNSAACMAEWLRPYDISKIFENQAVEKDLISMFALGDMDLGRIGKYVIDGESGAIVQETILKEVGNLEDIPHIGKHTWGVGLYAYRDMIAADAMVNEIKDIYYQCYGMDARMLTEFIYDLYKDYPNRSIPADEVVNYTRQNIPSDLVRVNTDTMEIEDFYQFSYNQNLRSVHFIPRKQDKAGILPSRNGYIFTTLVIGTQVAGTQAWNYTPEIWIFDANNLNQGAICKLTHPALDFTFTLHSAWVKEMKSGASDYFIPVKEDYESLIRKMIFPWRRRKLREFMNQYVYPNFQD